MLAQLVVDQAVTGRALFVAIGPSLNRRFTAACRLYAAELVDPAPKDDTDRVGFSVFTLETVVAALEASGADSLARALHDRYLAFDRVLATALDGIAAPSLHQTDQPAQTTWAVETQTAATYATSSPLLPDDAVGNPRPVAPRPRARTTGHARRSKQRQIARLGSRSKALIDGENSR